MSTGGKTKGNWEKKKKKKIGPGLHGSKKHNKCSREKCYPGEVNKKITLSQKEPVKEGTARDQLHRKPKWSQVLDARFNP